MKRAITIGISLVCLIGLISHWRLNRRPDFCEFDAMDLEIPNRFVRLQQGRFGTFGFLLSQEPNRVTLLTSDLREKTFETFTHRESYVQDYSLAQFASERINRPSPGCTGRSACYEGYAVEQFVLARVFAKRGRHLLANAWFERWQAPSDNSGHRLSEQIARLRLRSAIELLPNAAYSCQDLVQRMQAVAVSFPETLAGAKAEELTGDLIILNFETRLRQQQSAAQTAEQYIEALCDLDHTAAIHSLIALGRAPTSARATRHALEKAQTDRRLTRSLRGSGDPEVQTIGHHAYRLLRIIDNESDYFLEYQIRMD